MLILALLFGLLPAPTCRLSLFMTPRGATVELSLLRLVQEHYALREGLEQSLPPRQNLHLHLFSIKLF